MINKILVALDGSPGSLAALRKAAAAAKAVDGSLLLLHVMEVKKPMLIHDDFTGNLVYFLNETVARLQAEGKRILETAKARVDVDFKYRLELGNPAEVICDAAKNESCDLIAMGSRGLNDFAGMVLGSVSHRVLQRSSVPVLIARGSMKEADAIKTVLVPVDGSEHSKLTLREAADFASLFSARLLILHVIPELSYPPYYMGAVEVGPAAAFYEEDERKLKEAGVQILSKAISNVSTFPVSVETRLETGDPPEIITRVAAERNADLIVMGTSGPGKWESFWDQGVSHRVLQKSPCPVLFAKNLKSAEVVPAAAKS